MGESDRRPLPIFVLVILALFGLASVQTLTGPASKPESSEQARGEEKKGPADSGSRWRERSPRDRDEERILGPLLDYYRKGLGGDGLRDAAFERARVDGLRVLVAAVPDPVRSTNSHRFDEWIGVIQRAFESEGFVLDGFRLPWGAGEEPAGDAGRPAPAKAEPAAARAPATDDPGLLLFRGERTPGPIRVTPLLAVLLVPETPTLGLDKAAMARGFELAATWDAHNRPRLGPKTFHLLGPIFSGSQTSLEQALSGWTSRLDAPRVVMGAMAAALEPTRFRIVSGSASAIAVDDLKTCAWPHSVEFSATVHRGEVLLRAMLEHLGGSSARVALLVEANTQFGRSTRPRDGTADQEPVYYPFPLHISKVRGYYQKQGYLSDLTSGRLRSFERLPIPFEEAGDATDIPPMRTPGFTTAIDELVLGQILADISRRDIRAVGIVATDPLDTVFLARQVRQFLPDVRLFTPQSYLLYTHPQNVDDLRGMLVASTYPLYPPNQLRSYSYQGDVAQVFFSSESTQGTYNAAIAHLESLGDPRHPARFLEYGVPFDPPGSYDFIPGAPPRFRVERRKPPIWIGAVGNHGLYPLAVLTTLKSGPFPDEGYLYEHVQQEAEYTGMLGLPPPRRPGEDEDAWSRRQEGAWRRVRDWFRPEFPRPWIYLFAVASAACLAWAGLGLLVSSWVGAAAGARSGFGRFPMTRLAIFLNCRRAEDAARPGDEPGGPGPYLPIALLLLLLAYLAIIAPHLEAMASVPWIPLDPRESAAFWVGIIAYAVLWALAISLALSLVAWRKASRVASASRAADGGGVVGSAIVASAVVEGERVLVEATITAATAGLAAAPVAGARMRRRWRIGAAALFGLAFLGPPAARIAYSLSLDGMAYDFPAVGDAGREVLIRLARWMAIPSGVSPALTMMFIGAAGVAWVHAQLRRRFLREQYTPEIPAPDAGAARPPGDAGTIRSIQGEAALADRVVESLAWPFRGAHVAWPIAQAALLTLLVPLGLVPVLTGSPRPSRSGGSLVEVVAGLLIIAIFGLLGTQWIQLVALWWRIRKVMGLMLHLPMAPALDRLPSRVAAWLKEPPRPGDGRFDLIRRQARALAEQGEDDRGAVRDEDPILGGRFDPAGWAALNAHLKRVGPRDLGGVILPIRDYLVEHWKSLAIVAAFPDAPAREAQPAGEGGISGDLRAIATAVSGAEVPPAEAPPRLPDWVRLAEDLLAMSFLRWLAAAMAQVWTLVGSLVVGSVALLFAISSYPFAFQERLLLGMGLLIGALAVMILAIVVGFNRDEMISRLSNTEPNRLKFDRQLMGSLFAYLIPLLGALAAISSNVSDTIRSLVDPILRHLR